MTRPGVPRPQNKPDAASASFHTTSTTASTASLIAYFAISIVINSAGNVLTLVTSAKIHPSYLGAAYWTAATANFGNALHWNLFWSFIIIGLMTIVLNALLVGHWSWQRALGNLLFMLPFSALIQVFADFFNGVYPFFAGLPAAHSPAMIIFYICLNFFGDALIGIAISIYQRVNLILHPADDLMQILRFKYLKGHAATAMWVSYLPPTILTVIALIISHQFTNFGLGTIFALLFQGGITGAADKIVFPRLHHRAIHVSQN
ncbi:MAG: fructose permease [Oenococcus sp.]|uniref:Fructose permease n=1 Tax=Oenococcus kitaharae DSM 17330 TaxID=1045004 RepID=G9WIU5_9LACO|nr:hypothetical protein [Oenococcus kitaharae]EHN58394.1 hypothetical protein OKIT_0269 [Oenococcus kitaharae DSM 17330]MCV3296364.1 fructose permease [Oenococcus kitaharae]